MDNEKQEEYERAETVRSMICPEKLEKLSGDENHLIRSIVASNPWTSLEVLERLCGDKDGYVRLIASINPKILDRY